MDLHIDNNKQSDFEIVRYDENSGLYITASGKVLREVTQWKNKNGYCFVTHNRKNLAVHRLVAKMFVLGMSSINKIVMHKDDNPSNNLCSNLKWGTYSENTFDAYKHGLKTNNKKIRCMETGEEFYSAAEAGGKMFGNRKRGDHILQAARSERNKAYGYHWEVVER